MADGTEGFSVSVEEGRDGRESVAGSPKREGTIKERGLIYELLIPSRRIQIQLASTCQEFDFVLDTWAKLATMLVTKHSAKSQLFNNLEELIGNCWGLRLSVGNRERCVFYWITPTKLKFKTNRSTNNGPNLEKVERSSFSHIELFLNNKKVRGRVVKGTVSSPLC